MSDKPKGLAARLNKNIIKNKPSAVLTPESTVVVAPEPAPIVPIVEPTRHIGAWSKGIDSIRGAVNLPNPVIAKPVSTKVGASVLSKSNKDYLGYITDEDDITDEDEE